MALVKLTINTDKIITDLRHWLSDEETLKRIAAKIDEWTDTGAVDPVDILFIRKFLSEILK